QNDVTLKMPAFEWVHVQLHQQKGMISLSPPTICNSAVTNIERESCDDRRFSFEPVGAPRSLTNTQGMQITAGYISFEERGMHTNPR
ncbi:hypothetical protein, partial [Citrobacter freundii]|uniref:hypothetical protein n=1 Tax=Citrobacter freundii TaxID=546 RepID=UPI001A91A474